MSAIGTSVTAISVATKPASSEVIFQGPMTMGWSKDVNGATYYYHQAGVDPSILTEGRRIELVLTLTQSNSSNYAGQASTTVVVPYTVGGHSSSFVANFLQTPTSTYTSYIVVASDRLFGKLFFINNILCVQLISTHTAGTAITDNVYGGAGTAAPSNLHLASIVLEEIRTRV